MAIIQKQVDVAKSYDDVGALICTLVADIKAKKDVSGIVSDTLTPLISLIGEVGDLKGDITANRKAALSTLGARLGELVDALI